MPHSPFGPISRGMTGSLGGRAVTAPLAAEVFEGTVERNSVSEGIETKLSGRRIPSCGALNADDFGNSPPRVATDVGLLLGGSATATALGEAQEETNTATGSTRRERIKVVTVIE